MPAAPGFDVWPGVERVPDLKNNDAGKMISCTLSGTDKIKLTGNRFISPCTSLRFRDITALPKIFRLLL
jgi:hypothetical protein